MPPPSTQGQPLWMQIADGIRQRVESGEWAAGERLPSQRQLAEEYGAGSHMPVNRAVIALINEGVLATDPHAPRRGVRVRSSQILQRDIFGGPSGQSFEDETGAVDVSVTVAYSWGNATPEVARLLQVDTGTEILTRTFRYSLDGTPHQVAREYMRADLARQCGLTGPDAEVPGRSTDIWLAAAGIELHRETLRLQFRAPTESERDELAIPVGAQVVDKTVITYDATDVPLDARRILIVSDRIIYTAERTRDQLDPASGADQC